jgi:hypothetical protein
MLSPVLSVMYAYEDKIALTMAIGDVLMTLGSTLPMVLSRFDGITLLLTGLSTARLAIVVAHKGETDTLATRREG